MAIAPAPRRTDLLERDHLLARLHAAHDTAAGGRGRLVLVAGEAGVGKTSLVRRFCEELPDTNGVLWVRRPLHAETPWADRRSSSRSRRRVTARSCRLRDRSARSACARPGVRCSREGGCDP